MSDTNIKVCVLGLGYIGLPTASLLATKGFDVHGCDRDMRVVETIRNGHIHIREPELDVLVKSAVHSGRLTASQEPAVADVFIISVPTPFTDGHKPDLGYVESASRSIASYLVGGNLVLLESTSPVGTTERVADWIREERPDLELPQRTVIEQSLENNSVVHVAHCPERVLPGRILRELVENDRIVGGMDVASTEAAASFYREFVSGQILETDSRTAELTKLAENTFRDVNIALANELSIICEELDVNVWQMIEFANHHPRVDILEPGPGVGGHCIAIDPWFIVDSAPDQSRLIRTAREVNSDKSNHVFDKVSRWALRIRNPTIACLGLAYKSDIDDLRESPALEITRRLASQGVGEVIAVEPNIENLPDGLANVGVKLVSLEVGLRRADIVVGLVDHAAFKRVDRTLLQDKIVIDTRGIWR